MLSRCGDIVTAHVIILHNIIITSAVNQAWLESHETCVSQARCEYKEV